MVEVRLDEAAASMAEVSEAGEVRESRCRERRESSERLRQADVVLDCMAAREAVRVWIWAERVELELALLVDGSSAGAVVVSVAMI